MNLAISRGIARTFPDIEDLLADIAWISVRLDRDIRTECLRVELRKNPRADRYSGEAWGETSSRHWTGQTHTHDNGRVRLNLGTFVGEEDIIRVFSHELRHIGQFHRGLKKYKTLTIEPLSPAESEDDAYAFEDRVLEHL